MKIVVLEPRAAGHHGSYLAWLLRGLAGRGHRLALVTTEQVLTHPSLAGTVPCENADAMVQELPAFVGKRRASDGGLVWRELRYWALFRSWYRQSAGSFGPDVVLLPYLDYCLYTFGLLGSPFSDTPVVGIAMRPSFHYAFVGVRAPSGRLAAAKERLFNALLARRTFRVVMTSDVSLLEYMRHRQRAEKVRYLPHPVDGAPPLAMRAARRALGLPQEVDLLLVYGAIDERKGVHELLQALRHDGWPPSLHVLFAGTASGPIEGRLLSETALEDRIHVMNRFLSEQEENQAFSASDIVWLGYKEHYTASGVLVQAARRGLPAIATTDGVIGWQTRRFGLGLVVDPTDADAVSRAAAALVGDEAMATRFSENGRAFAAENSTEEAVEAVEEALRLATRQPVVTGGRVPDAHA